MTKMKIIVFDTETTGFINYQRPIEDASQPLPVQIAAGIFSSESTYEGGMNMLVNIAPYVCPQKVQNFHHITQARTEKFGFKPVTALSILFGMIAGADIVVGHNVKYDQEIIRSAAHRFMPSMVNMFAGKRVLCTQEMSAPIVNLPPTEKMLAAGFNKPKAPKLEEAYKFLFGEDLRNAHDGFADMMGCARVFFEIINREGWEKYRPAETAAS